MLQEYGAISDDLSPKAFKLTFLRHPFERLVSNRKSQFGFVALPGQYLGIFFIIKDPKKPQFVFQPRKKEVFKITFKIFFLDGFGW